MKIRSAFQDEAGFWIFDLIFQETTGEIIEFDSNVVSIGLNSKTSNLIFKKYIKDSSNSNSEIPVLPWTYPFPEKTNWLV